MGHELTKNNIKKMEEEIEYRLMMSRRQGLRGI